MEKNHNEKLENRANEKFQWKVPTVDIMSIESETETGATPGGADGGVFIDS